LHYTLYSPAVCMGYLCILRPSWIIFHFFLFPSAKTGAVRL
jgi:hypothetical protein